MAEERKIEPPHNGWEISLTIAKWLSNPGISLSIIGWGGAALFPMAGSVLSGIGLILGNVALLGMAWWCIEAIALDFISTKNNAPKGLMHRWISSLNDFLDGFSTYKKSNPDSRFPFTSYVLESIRDWVIKNPGTTFLILLGIIGSLTLAITIGTGAMAPLLDSMASQAFDSMNAFINAIGGSDYLTSYFTPQFFAWQTPFLMTLAPLVLTHGLHTIIDTFSPQKPVSRPETTKDSDNASARPETTGGLQKDTSSDKSSVFSNDKEPTITTDPAPPEAGASLLNGFGRQPQ